MLEFVSNSTNDSQKDSLKDEVERYLNCKVSATESLDWWRENEKVKYIEFI